MLTIQQAKFLVVATGSVGHPVSETIFGWYRYDDNVAFLPTAEQDKLNYLADLIVSSFEQSDFPPFREVKIVGHADKDWHERGASLEGSTDWEDSVSENRARAVDEYLKDVVPKLWHKRGLGPMPAGTGTSEG